MATSIVTGTGTVSLRTERYRNILMQELLADVTFLVGRNKVPIKANKTILRCGSSVFWELFDETVNKEQNAYEVPDLEPEEFRKFLEYLYTGELNSDSKDAGLMLRGAMLYETEDLAQHCVKQLIESLNVDNCGSILDLALVTKNKELEDATVKFICEFAIPGGIFAKEINFSEEALLKILPRDELDVDELELFEAIVNWGKREVVKAGANPDNPKYLRSILENLIKYIRFPLMEPSDFSTIVDPTELLTSDEVMAVLLCFNVSADNRASYKARIFNSKPRVANGKKCQYCKYVVTIGRAQTAPLLLVKDEWGDEYYEKYAGIASVEGLQFRCPICLRWSD